jgi:uncharacterized protein (TIGR02453 family)
MPLQSDTLAFLAELAEHNERPWFQANKARYEAARDDVARLSEAVMAGWGALEALPPVEPRKTLFRIYRDVRFSADKSPYKPWLSFYIPRGPGRVGLFLRVRPGGQSMTGTGVYDPDPAALAAIRQEIDYNADALRQILGAARLRKTWGELGGETLKRAPKGYAVDDPNIDLLRHKQFILMRTLPDEALTAKGLEKDLVAAFRAAKPFMDWIDAPLLEAREGTAT